MISTIIEPKSIHNFDAISADNFDTRSSLIPHDDFVISRNRDGSVASYYGDKSWDFTSYNSQGRSSWLHFPYRNVVDIDGYRDTLSHDARWLMFLIISKRIGAPLSFSTLKGFNNAIVSLTKYAEKNGCFVRDILSDTASIYNFINSGVSGATIESLARLLSLLLKLGTEQTGIVVPGMDTLITVRNKFQQSKMNSKQHPPIPTRIYSIIISRLTIELDEFERVIDKYLALVQACAADQYFGRSKTNQYNKAKKNGLDGFEIRMNASQVIQEYGLDDFLKSKGYSLDVVGLASYISEIQMVTKLLLQIYSGMRDEEAGSIPYHCLDMKVENGKTHYIVLGRTTKLTKGRIKRTRWVTSREGHRAIIVAQRIAHTIYEAIGVKPEVSQERLNRFPLFISTAYLPYTAKKITCKHGIYLPFIFKLVMCKRLKSRVLPYIENCDVVELERVDAYRAWRTEAKFSIGNPWPLTTHQFRRSLALYAQRSGIVSMPSLRRQLQHITEEMARYYAKGSAFARNFINNTKEHFGIEWQKSGPVSAAISFIYNVIESDEILFGSQGEWVKNRLRRPDGSVLIDREETIRRFKKGELAFRETVLGGCTNTGDCKQAALNWLEVDCLINCKHLVGKLPNLERAIVAQTSMVESLNRNSVEFRTEQVDLEVLVAVRDKILNQLKTEEYTRAATFS